ncbi:Transcriptional regulator [Planctomycetales bacterium 10988]|nr:Transcriptional regulator [Planctomycetales bacterium 10988]
MPQFPSSASPLRSSLSSEERIALKQEFLEQIGRDLQFQSLFEHLPGVFFFVKDTESRMICASRAILKRLGVSDEEEMIGMTDYDYFPPQIADAFVRDDQFVVQTGQSILNRVEIWYTEQRLLDWFVTNKLPVRNEAGKIIGVMGTVRSYEGSKKLLLPYTQISEAVEFIRTHHREKISVEAIAEHTNISPRQLHRKFKEVFGMSIQDFLGKTRIQAASDVLLSTTKGIAEIAIEFGYCDQSAFTKQFRKYTGLTPLKFRKKYML